MALFRKHGSGLLRAGSGLAGGTGCCCVSDTVTIPLYCSVACPSNVARRFYQITISGDFASGNCGQAECERYLGAHIVAYSDGQPTCPSVGDCGWEKVINPGLCTNNTGPGGNILDVTCLTFQIELEFGFRPILRGTFRRGNGNNIWQIIKELPVNSNVDCLNLDESVDVGPSNIGLGCSFTNVVWSFTAV